MNINGFEEISIRGRIAFAISGFENALRYLDYRIDDWKVVLEYLWKYTSAHRVEMWNSTIKEIIPENLMNYERYDDKDFNHISKGEFKYLYKLYNKSNIITLMNHIYYIASSESGDIIIGNGKSSLNCLQAYINEIQRYNVPLPCITPYSQYSIDKNNGWGSHFNGEKISRVL